MKMRAGWKLWGKNPTHIPSTITDTIGEIEPSASSPVVQALRVQEEGAGRDRDGARCQPVEAVDEVHRVGDPRDPQHGDERGEVG